MFSSAFVVLALSASAFATVFVTSPVASTTFTGGKSATVSWQDDGKQPTLQSFGPAIVSIYAGNSQQQTLLQTITPSVDVSGTQAVVFTPDPSIGPNGNEYFVRFQSINLKDTTQPQFPALAFSAKFTMSGMSGTFNATVQSQIDGQSTAPIGGTAAASSSGSAPAATTPATTASKASSSSSSGSAAGGAAKTSAAAGASSTNGAVDKLAGATVAIFAGAAFAVLGSILC
jgi:hypothetical protein